MMASCIVHYGAHEESDLLPLTKEHYERLVEAKKCRCELGGENLHALQSNDIPNLFPDNRFLYSNCY